MTEDTSELTQLGHRTFECPHCKALAAQDWFAMGGFALDYRGSEPVRNRQRAPNAYTEWFDQSYTTSKPYVMSSALSPDSFGPRIVAMHLSRCHACQKVSIWYKHKCIFPSKSSAPAPNEDLSEDVKRDYLEAAEIVDTSPRGAAALLRLCVEKLANELNAQGRTLDDKIGWLISEKGLSVEIQRMLDTVRVIGNEAVHPGSMDLKDDVRTASMLFAILNLIAMQLLTQPRLIEEQWNTVPAKKRKAAEDRDARNAAKKKS